MSGLASRKTRGGLGRRSKRGEDDKQLGGGKQSSSNPASAQSHVPTRSPVEDKSQEPEEQTGQQQLEIPLDEGQQEQENQHHHQQQHTLLVDHVGRVSYVVAVRKDHPTNFYVKDLELSMDLMAMDNALPGMAVHIPTSVDGTLETNCPEFVDSTRDRCQDVTHSIGVMFEDGQRQRRISNSRSYEQHEQKQQQLSSEFQRQLEAAILEEQLQDSLNRINSHAPVWIVTGALQAPYEYERAPPSNLAELSPKTKTNVPMGTLIGMVVAALLALVLGTALLVRRRHHKKRLSHFEIKQQDTSSEDEDGGKSSKGVKSPFDFDYDQRDQCGFSFDYNQRERKHLLELETAAAVPSAAHNAYSPGWAGYASSYSSNSDSEAEQNYSLPHSYCSPDNKGRVVSTVPKDYLVDIGASWAREGYEQAASSNSSITSAEDVDKTLAELDASIEKGDWAAVGVAAAGLLAFPEYADDAASRASSRRSSDRDHKQAASPQRETEIDRLIECGDWEAVIMAASRFDAEETLSPIVQARRLSLSSSNSSIGLLQSMDEGGEKSSRSKNVGARSRTTTMSEANTQIRDQIEELVQDVVPEEMDNIDELIFQFQGQEEELLETLRTMKERFVSQKARLARNKLAQRVALETMAQRPALETVAFNNNNNVNNITISSVSSNSYTASSNTISGSSLVQQEAWRGVTSFSKSVEPPNNTARSLSDMTAKDEAEEGQFVGGRDKSGHLI